ncbi:MAG: helix-turn-helix domain containing protein [Candidatus Kuenenia sp.]|nr:helix-turn-helix domain containing protein [Candidatus Kuenenia hertensis]
MSEEVKRRQAWFEYYEECGRNARKTCKYFGISPDTFYRWKKRYRPNDPSSLKDDKKSRRPKRTRQLSTSQEVIDRIKILLETHPVKNKKEIKDLLRRENIDISLSTFYRIINRLKRQRPFQNHETKRDEKNDRKITGYSEYLSLLKLWKDNQKNREVERCNNRE